MRRLDRWSRLHPHKLKLVSAELKYLRGWSDAHCMRQPEATTSRRRCRVARRRCRTTRPCRASSSASSQRLCSSSPLSGQSAYPLPLCLLWRVCVDCVCRNYASNFEKAKTAIEEGGGRDELAEDYQGQNSSSETSRPASIRVDEEKRSSDEKV